MQKIFNHKNKYEIGVDEAGRGPLFGRVYSAAVILPRELDCSEIKDSKRFTSEKKLKRVYEYIKQHALFYSIDYVSEETIDKINIREATFLSMKKSFSFLFKRLKFSLISSFIYILR